MPIFSTQDAIKKCMEQNHVINWRVLSDNNEQIHEHFPSATTTVSDSYNELMQFLETLQGNYVAINLYNKKYDDKESGEVAKGAARKQLTYRHYFKLSSGNTTPQPIQGLKSEGNGVFGIGEYIALHNTINELKTDFERRENQRTIADLESKLRKLEKGDGKHNYLNDLLEKVAKNIALEFAGTKDIALTHQVTEATPAIAENNAKAETTTKDQGEAGTTAKRASNAVMRLIKIGGVEAIDGLETIAKLLEEKPLEAAQLLQQIHDKAK